jgi:CubicO group peptidase (beta-lactamase class C family)
MAARIYPEEIFQAIIQFIMKISLILIFIFLAGVSCQKASIYFPGETWRETSSEKVGLDSLKLKNALEFLESHCGENGVSEVLLIKDGYIVYKGDNVKKQHNIWSCTKSFTGIAFGLLQQDGKCTLEDKASRYAPFLGELYPDVTLRHFATMTSGYNAVGTSRWNEKSEDWSWTPFVPDTPLFAPGMAYCYWDEAMMTFGYSLTAAANRDLKDLLDERIFKPIGAGDWKWGDEPSELEFTVRNGCTGIEITAMQLARIGYLILNKGKWNGTQLINSQWVTESTQNQVPVDIVVADTDRKSIDGRGNYGYNWWTNGADTEGNTVLPDMPEGTHYMSGLNNNVCFVVPEWNLVFVRMGTDGNPLVGKSYVYNNFFKLLMK